MRIGLARRGYSPTGGAENYLKRFASALVQAGHECLLFGSPEWPTSDWLYGELRAVPGKTPLQFADALHGLEPKKHCDYLFSLERVWSCDCYRAGDGVHQAWLERRARYEPAWKRLFRSFNLKHGQLLKLESHLLTPGGPGALIANSNLVKQEILQHSSYPAERIHVVYNGLPDPGPALAQSQNLSRELIELRARCSYLVLFAGSGWERKGLKFAIQAFERAAIPNSALIVAGRGNPKLYKHGSNVHFTGPVQGLKGVLSIADAFILPTLYDPFSNACLEAAAAGLPVITTGSNGMSEIIRPEMDGEIVTEPSDVPALARAISNWSDKEKRESTRSHRLQLGRAYSIESNLDQTLAILSGQPGSPG